MNNRDDLNNPQSEQALQEELQNAYQVSETPESLKQRVAWMAEGNPAPKRPGAARLRFARLMAAASLVLVLGATLAWRYYFGRLGETAISLIPADAGIVVTLDTTPSAAQAPLFLRISKALQAAGIDRSVDSAVKGMLNDDSSPISAEIRAHLTTSFAFAMLDIPKASSPDSGQPVVFLAVKDPVAVESIVAKSGHKVTQNGITYYRFKSDDQVAMILANYLVCSSSPAILRRVQMTYSGQLASVANLKDYQEARAELPEDATLMVFVSPTALATMNDEGRKLGVAPFKDTRWMAMSATLRDQGIAFDYRSPMSTMGHKGIAAIARSPAIDAAAYKELPAGAYGVAAMSNPAGYWDMVTSLMDGEPGVRREMESGLQEFEKESGFSVTGEILPAFRGRSWLAVYPNAEDAAATPDGLIVIDGSNSANPGRLADKVRLWLEKVSTDNGKPGIRFLSSTQGDTTIWRLDDDTRRKLQDAAGSAMKEIGGSVAGGSDGVSQTPPVSSWSPAFAQIGTSVVIASSDSMLNRALAAHQGLVPTLADDAAFTSMRQSARPDAQGIVMVNLAAVMKRMEPQLHEWLKDGPVSADDVVNLFGAAGGLVGSGSFDGQVQRGSMFLPVDYERLIRLIGAMTADDKAARAEKTIELR